MVELTGALAGFSFSLAKANVIAAAGVIVGVSAACSMAASEYLSQSEDKDESKSAIKASIYTGVAYLIVVIILISPYLLINKGNILIPLSITLVFALIIFFLFTYYTSIAKNTNFKRRFIEMAGLSLIVAIFTFILGFVANAAFGISA